MTKEAQQYWHVRLSYLSPSSLRQGCRDNAILGIVAPTIENAIELAKLVGVPEGGEDVKVWSASHGGGVHAMMMEKSK